MPERQAAAARRDAARHRPDRRMPDHQPSGKPPPPIEEDVGPVRDDVLWFGRFHEVVIDMEPPLTLLKRDRRLLDPVRAAGRHLHMRRIVPAAQ